MEQESGGTGKRLILFVVLVLVIGWSVFSLIPLAGLNYGEKSAIIILAAAMFSPALASLLTRLITKEGFQNTYLNPRFQGHLKEYLLIFFGPSFLLLFSALLYFLIFPGNFDSDLTLLGIPGAAGLSPTVLMMIGVVQIIVLGPVANLIPTLGEELGWRGYLLPKLRELFSDRAALVISGAIWGVWHLPVIVMGHNYGTDYVGYPWLGVLAMIVFCVVLGIIEGYAAIKLESAIPAAIIHSTVNAGAALPVLLAKGEYNILLGPAITGLIGGLPFIAVAAILFIKAGNLRPEKT